MDGAQARSGACWPRPDKSRAAAGIEARTGIAAVIPVLNEAESIGQVIGRIPREAVDVIIVADGGSTDDTVAVAEAAGAQVIRVGKGYGRACLEGALAAGDGCSVVVYMDGDGSDCVEDIARLTAPIAAGTHDFVIGSRIKGKRAPGSMALHQILAGRMIGAAIGAIHGFRYTDMCAFRAIRRDALLRLGMREMTYGWNLEMQMKAAKAGLRILEVSIPYSARMAGVSKVAGSLRGSVKAGARIVLTFFRVLLGR